MKKSKSITRLIQGIVLVFLFATVLLQIQNTGTVSNISEELIYWERARLLVGQGGLSQYDGTSLASLGYSLLLAPICLVLNSPYAAYKAAMLLCGFFYCVSYIISVITAKKLFPEESERFLSLACFFVMICPVFTFAKGFTGPETIVLFLMWLNLYLLVSLWKEYKKSKLVVLTVSLLFMGFFQVSSIGAILAIVVILGFFAKRKKIDETTHLTFVLALLVGMAAGNIAERAVLTSIYSEYEIEVASSFEVFVAGISAGWEKYAVAGLASSVVAKLFVGAIGSFLIACAGYWHFIKESFACIKKKMTDDNYIITCIIFVPFVFQLIIWALYSNSLSINEGLASISNMEVFLLPVILTGIIQIKKSVCWEKELTGYVLFMCVSAFITANIYQKNGISSISKVNNSIMILLHNGTRKPVAIVYMVASIAILSGIILFGCFKSSFRKSGINRALKCSGTVGLLAVCVFMNMLIFKSTAVYENDNIMKYVAPIASLLSSVDTDAQYYYVYGGGSDGNAPILQSLVPGKEIEAVANNKESYINFFEEADTDTDEIVLITGTNESFIKSSMEKYQEEYRMLYATSKHVVWAHRGSEICEKLDQAVCSRIENLELSDIDVETIEEVDEVSTETELENQQELTSEAVVENETDTETEAVIITEEAIESETEIETETELETELETDRAKIITNTIHTYGGSANILAPGTYRLEVYFQTDNLENDLSGRVTVSSDGDKIASKEVKASIFDESGKGAVVIEFTGREIMRKFEVTIEGSIAAESEITDVYYWKQSSAYTVGLNAGITKNACEAILTLDEKCEANGTVAYVADIMTEKSDISVRCFEDRLSGYDVEVVSKEELADLDTDYLIGVTSSHPYYNAMDRYSIIKRNRYYTVLVRNDSEQYQKYLEEESKLLSTDKEIKLTAFLGKDTSLMTPFALEAGSYNYRMKLLYSQEELSAASSETIGTVYICDGEEVICEHVITKTMLESGVSGEAELFVPLVLRMKATSLECKFESETVSGIEIIPQAIELTSEKYQFGQEEDLQEFYDLINQLEDTKCYVVQTYEKIKEAQTSYDYLQEQMPQCEIDTITYDQANSLVTDTFLITYDFSKEYMQLLRNYSIIAHAGQYTLWVKSNGGLLQKVVEAGAQVLSNGKRISPISIEIACGEKEVDNIIEELPNATYSIILEVSARELKSDDTIEVALLGEKDEKSIADEVNALVEKGYKKDIAEQKIESKIEYGNITCKAFNVYEADDFLISINTKNQKIVNMSAEAYSWHGCDVEVKIIWLEIL